MKDNQFFKPTPLYKEYMLLDLIEKDSHVTQRQMSQTLEVALSMVNSYLEAYEQQGYLERKYRSPKMVEYHITKKGIERKKVLNIWYLKSSQRIYQSAKDNICSFLHQIIEKGFKKILLYGAGEVAEIMLQVLNEDKKIPLEVIAVIDDDPNKKGETLVNIPIIQKESIEQYEHDGIMVASYTHQKKINKILDLIAYPKLKIINFFDN